MESTEEKKIPDETIFVELAVAVGMREQRAKVLYYMLNHREQVNAKDLELTLGIPQPRTSDCLNWLARNGYIEKHRLASQGQGRPFWQFKTDLKFEDVGRLLIGEIERREKAVIEANDNIEQRIRAQFGL